MREGERHAEVVGRRPAENADADGLAAGWLAVGQAG